MSNVANAKVTQGPLNTKVKTTITTLGSLCESATALCFISRLSSLESTTVVCFIRNTQYVVDDLRLCTLITSVQGFEFVNKRTTIALSGKSRRVFSPINHQSGNPALCFEINLIYLFYCTKLETFNLMLQFNYVFLPINYIVRGKVMCSVVCVCP